MDVLFPTLAFFPKEGFGQKGFNEASTHQYITRNPLLKICPIATPSHYSKCRWSKFRLTLPATTLSVAGQNSD